MCCRPFLMVGLAAAVVVVPLTAQDVLERARILYESAAYEEALLLLDGYEQKQPADRWQTSRADTVDEYRALSLLALNRASDAEAVLAALIARNPLYASSFRDPPPRFVTAVANARNKVIPQIVGQLFAEAKAAAARHRYEDAAVALGKLLRVVRQDGSDPVVVNSLTDVVHAATELLEVSRRSQTVYTVGDIGVTPPVTVRQTLPDPSGLRQRILQPYSGQLELIIGTNGAVESASLIASVHPDYDSLLLKTARMWTYRPAQKDGRAVPWRMVMTIHLTPVAPAH